MKRVPAYEGLEVRDTLSGITYRLLRSSVMRFWYAEAYPNKDLRLISLTSHVAAKTGYPLQVKDHGDWKYGTYQHNYIHWNGE